MSFGGPAGQIALMYKELVEKRRWIGEERFLHALNYCMLLPGPEAQQLAVYIGWLMHKTPGGVAAGTLFILPGLSCVLVLSMLYAAFGDLSFVQALLFGLKAAVLAVVLEALLRIGKRALRNLPMLLVAAGAFLGIFLFDVSFPYLIVAAAALGVFAHRFRPNWFVPPQKSHVAGPDTTIIGRMEMVGALAHTRPSLAKAARVVGLSCVLWALPLGVIVIAFGRDSIFAKQGMFFSQTAVVTFGGAYAVLAYIAQQAVVTFDWLSADEMLDGLSLAETTPGPLILVLQFVAFLGAYHTPGGLSPMVAGTLGSFVTVWVTFMPCFLWIFLGAPYIEALRGHRAVNAALSTITAAVVGVILNLSIWLGVHVLFRHVSVLRFGPLHVLQPDVQTIDGAAVFIWVGAMLAMFKFKLTMPKTLVVSTVVGSVWKLFAPA